MIESEFKEMNDFDKDFKAAMNTVTVIVAVFVAFVFLTVAYFVIF